MSAPKVGRFTSAAIPLPLENIDTDQIVPARYLKVIDKAGLAEALFRDWRFNADDTMKVPPFILDEPRYRGRSILVAGENFGSGSSREHAPWALLAFGIKAVIATSFADIFKNNALKNGLLPIVVPHDLHAQLLAMAAGDGASEITIDLATATLDSGDGAPYQFPIDVFNQKMLVEGLDELDYVRTHSAEIAAYESAHPRPIDTRSTPAEGRTA
jgi:3-isopropylmalate/(R)-2-methylmalate dehydratase small subunit